jgi:uncharacterized protein YxjI
LDVFAADAPLRQRTYAGQSANLHSMSEPMYLPQFFVKQRITMMVNRYEIIRANPDGTMGELIAFAEQKRFAFREQVTFFSDAGRTQPLFGFKARKVIDLGSGYDVTDATGQPIGFFRKDFAASLLRSTFHLEGAGFSGTGQEQNMLIAILRRFTDLDFLPVHFDFVSADGQPLMLSTRQFSLRDKYTVTVQNPNVDFRVAAAMAVALDVLMAR